MTMTLHSEEVWRPIPSLEGWEASSEGRVRRVPHVKPMPHGGSRTYGGHAWFGHCAKDGRWEFKPEGRTVRVHQAVCEAFHGPKPFEGAVVMHLDEDNGNNRPENLAWGTQQQNLNAPGFKKYCRERRHVA